MTDAAGDQGGWAEHEQSADSGREQAPEFGREQAPEFGREHPAESERGALYEQGMEVRRAVLGDAHVDRAIANTTDFTAPFQEFITRYAWGAVWTRDGLDHALRADRTGP
jgi:hypothetical protein